MRLLFQGLPGTDGLPGELGKVGPPVSNPNHAGSYFVVIIDILHILSGSWLMLFIEVFNVHNAPEVVW